MKSWCTFIECIIIIRNTEEEKNSAGDHRHRILHLDWIIIFVRRLQHSTLFLITIKSTHICDALAHSFSHPRRIFWECADTFFWKRPSNSCTPASQPYPEFYANMHQLYSCVRVFVCAVCTAKSIISWSSTACNSQMERSKIISIPFHPQMQCGISSLHNNQFVPKIFFFFHFCRVCRSWLLFMVTVLTSVDASALPASREREYGYKKCWFSLVLLTDKL